MVNRHLFRRHIATALVANAMNGGTPTISQDGMNRLTTLTNARIASEARTLRFKTFLDRRRIERHTVKSNRLVDLKQSFHGLLDGQHQFVVRRLIVRPEVVDLERKGEPVGIARRPFTVITPIRVGRQIDLGTTCAFHIRTNERQRQGHLRTLKVQSGRPTVLGIGQT